MEPGQTPTYSTSYAQEKDQMRHLAITAATVTATLTLAACGGTSSPTAAPSITGSMPMMTTAPAAAGDRNQADVMFAQMMVPHHQQAIEMAQLASTRASSADVTALAGQIQAAQQPEIDEMRGWLTSWGVPTMPNDMGHGTPGGLMSRDDMAKLEGLSGTVFDREFLSSMTTHHQGAIDMAKAEQANGSYEPAKTMAANIIRTQTEEINKMAELLKGIQ
jgi:uncharacterized protein (DUF305 family)